jgi:hypothetical protein
MDIKIKTIMAFLTPQKHKRLRFKSPTHLENLYAENNTVADESNQKRYNHAVRFQSL